MELDNPKNLYSKNDLKIEIRHPFQQISKSNSSSGAKNCHWNPKKDTTPEKNSIRKPGTQKSMENCAFFLAIFSAQPGPTNRFLETLHGSSSRFALPFLPSRSCSGWVVFSEISLTTLPFNVFFGGLKELDQLTQKGVWKDGFFPTCRFVFECDVLTKRGPTKTGFVYKVVKSEQGWHTKFLKYGGWWEIINWFKKSHWIVILMGCLGVLAKKAGLVA